MIAIRRIVFLIIFIQGSVFLFLSTAFADDKNDALSSRQNIAQQLQTLEKIENSQQALEYSQLLLKRVNLSVHQKISILKVQERSYYQLNEIASALTVAKDIQSLAAKNNLLEIEAAAYKNIGIYHYFKRENHQAVSAYKKSIAFYKQVDEPIKLANLYNNIALSYAVIGDINKTLFNYRHAETIYQEKGTEEDKLDVRYNIAGLYLRLKRFDLAIELYLDIIEKLIKLGNESDNQTMLFKARGELGTTYKYSGEYNKSRVLLLQAIDYFEISGNKYELAPFYHNISDLYNMINQPFNAIKYATKAVTIGKNINHQSAHAGGLNSLARAQFSLGHVEQAYENLLLSDEIANEIDDKEKLSNNMALFSLIYAAQNKPRLAIQTYQEYSKRTTETSNDRLNTQLAEFESEQLKQKVNQLQQNEKLQQLQTEQAEQQRNFSLVAAAFILVVVFLIFNRNKDKRSKLKLSERVKHRTQELELLTHELVKANAIKSKFLANMSHEIRTPLTSIIGQAEAIINGDVDDQYLHKEVEIIHGNSLHLLELINNILDLSKVEANKLELELVEQDLQILLHELANMFTKQAKAKGLIFEIIHTLPSPFMLRIDSLRLKQILINLCSNAIKFTSKGSVRLNISLKGNALIIAVNDTGIGMSETQLQEVFTSFTQGDSSISRRFGGSGLGLCLSEQLAQLMSGKISVTSTLNQGSSFTLELPFQQFKSLELENLSPRSIVATTVTAVSSEHVFSGQIVLADDHYDNRRLIARLLTSLGLDVLCASNGIEAVELCLQNKPQLILMDIQMPEMDGIEAFKVLRQQGCEQPIVALTANAMSHEVEKYLALGFNGHLKKPIERKLFIATIAKYYGDKADTLNAEKTLTSVDMSDLVIEFKSNLVLEQQDLILLIKNNELKKLANLAHRIAGAAQMFGFSLVSVSAIKLEKSILAGTSQQISNAAQSLLNDIDQVLW